MTKATKDKDEGLSEMLGVRVSADDLGRLEALAERFLIGTKHSLARFARRVGIDALERDPVILPRGAVKGRNASRSGT